MELQDFYLEFDKIRARFNIEKNIYWNMEEGKDRVSFSIVFNVKNIKR